MKKMVKFILVIGIIDVLLTILLCLFMKKANTSGNIEDDTEDEVDDRFCQYCPNEEYL